MIVNANALALPLASGTVQTVVTSPPYYGLRDYGTATWKGGNSRCAHLPADTPGKRGLDNSTLSGGKKTTGHQQEGFLKVCSRCGAVRVDVQIGMEQTPDEYIANLVAVFREVWRVLRDDGTLWLNLGDSYAGSGKGGQSDSKRSENWQPEYANKGNLYGMKPKDLIGIPWRVAFALQADGWYLRSDIIWHKPNPMPESVKDRPTKAHEYVFLLSKSARYFWDAEAVKEPLAESTLSDKRLYQEGYETKRPERGYPGGASHGAGMLFPRDGSTGRNRRSVWTIATQPTPFAHFATMPEKLVEPCILAGSRAGDWVLDPFMGSGTVAKVAMRLGRKAFGTELNFRYIRDIASRRTAGLQPMLAEVR